MKRSPRLTFVLAAIASLLLAFPCISLAGASADGMGMSTALFSSTSKAGTSSALFSSANAGAIQQAGYFGPLTVYAENETVKYDGKPHGIVAEPSDPQYTVYYMDDAGAYTLTESPSYTALGTYTINFKATSKGSEAYGTATLTITKGSLKVIAIAQTKRFGNSMNVSDLTYMVAGAASGETPTITGQLDSKGLLKDATVGSYRITRGTLKVAGSDTLDLANYNVTFVGSRLRVLNDDGLTIAASDSEATYDGSAHELGTVTVKADGDKTADATIEYSVDGGAWTSDTPSLTDAGTADIRVRASLDGYVTTDSARASITVTPATLTVTANDANTIYGTALSTDKLTYTSTGAVDGETPVFSGTLSSAGAGAIKLGEYGITQGTLALADSDDTASNGFKASNYQLAFNAGKLSVVENTTLIVSVDDVTATYDGLPHSLGAVTTNINGKTTTRATVEYSSDGGKTWSRISPSVTDAGAAIEVLVRASLTGYTTTKPVKATITVTPATLKVTADDVSTTYGTAIDADKLTYTVVGAVPGQTPAFTGALSCDGAGATATGTFDITQGTLSLVDDATASGSASTAPQSASTSAGSASSASAGISTSGSASASSSASISADDGVVGSSFVSGGIADATFKASNYTLDFTAGTLTVAPNTTLAVTAQSATAVYDGQGHSLEDVAVTADGKTVTGATIEYSTDGGATWSSDTPVATDVADSSDISVRASLDGYKTTDPVTVSLSVTPATIEVTADDANTVFGTAIDPQKLTYKSIGTVSGQTPSFSGALASDGADATAVGEFDITQGTLQLTDDDQMSSGTGDTGFSASNYELTFTAGKLTVAQNTTLAITTKDVKATYDGNAHPLAISVTADGTVTDQATIEYSSDKGKTWTSVEPATVNVGDSATYLVRASLEGYATTTSAEASLAITPAAVKVTADDATTTFGTPLDPASLTYTSSAPVSWEVPAFAGTLSCDGAEATALGDFDIEQGTLALVDSTASGFLADNYTLSFTPGKLTVGENTTLAVTVSSVTATYDGKAHTLNDINVFADDVATDKATIEYSTDGGKTWTSKEPSATNVADSVDVLVRASLQGYATPDPIEASITIEKQPVTIEVSDARKTAGEGDPGFTIKTTGVVSGEELDYTVARTAGEEPGVYPIDITLGDGTVNDNYDITTKPGSLTIEAALVAESASTSTSTSGSGSASTSTSGSESASTSTSTSTSGSGVGVGVAAASSTSVSASASASGGNLAEVAGSSTGIATVSSTVATSGSGTAANIASSSATSGSMTATSSNAPTIPASKSGVNLAWLWLLLLIPAGGIVFAAVKSRSAKQEDASSSKPGDDTHHKDSNGSDNKGPKNQ